MIPAHEALIDLTSRPEDEPESISGCCRQHGDFEVAAVWFAGVLRNAEPSCPDCSALVEEVEERLAEIERQKRADEQIRRRLRLTGMPPRMLANNAPYESVTPRAGENFEATKLYATTFLDEGGPFETGACLLMSGMPGTGKTQLACRVGKFLTEHTTISVRYTTATEMSRSVRATYGAENDATETAVIDQWAACDLLILDELGVKLASDYDRSLLFEIMDKRYQNSLPSIVITNLGTREIGPATDERMVDRLRDNCTVLVFDWESYRGQKHD